MTHPGFSLAKTGKPAVLGMVHVQALPGTPFSRLALADLVRVAVEEAVAYRQAGFDGVVLENMHDRPYLKGAVGPEITAAMTRVAVAVRQAVGPALPVGIQILAGANREALAVALAADLQFIRAEGGVFGHVADEGWIESCAADLLRLRRQWGAEHIALWTDIQKKHSAHAVTADLGLADWAHAAEFFGFDGVIVTGTATGQAASPEHLAAVKAATRLPVAIGSGLSPGNARLFAAADAWIIGSSVKVGGCWENPLDPAALTAMVAARDALD
jgi:uncharacterized protein